MNCPECNADTKVIDSRPIEGGVRRRRCCKACGCRFSTEEVLVGQKPRSAQPEPSQKVVEAPKPKAPKPKATAKKFSAKKAADARRRIELMRDKLYVDDPFDYIPEKW